MKTRLINLLMVLSGFVMMVLGGGRLAMGQEVDTGEVIANDGISTEGIGGAKLPAAYRIKGIVRPGEMRTSEFFAATAITGNGSVTTLVSDKASHAGKFAGIRVYCIGVVAALCQLPPLQKNGQPITDSIVLRGGETVIQPFNSLVALDTSDSISMNGSFTITGAGVANVSVGQWEFYTPRSFQGVSGANNGNR